MYREYKKVCKGLEFGDVNRKINENSSVTHGYMKKCIQECWDTIDSVCTELMSSNKPAQKIQRNGWKTVRVFVSSTFTDFHSEREILVKQVFPSLREWCEPLKLRIVECDLRWGVPKDSPTSMTILTCMEELHRCNEETHCEPFFINMLGERYGWVPEMADVPDEVRDYWVPNTSITHMEILVGAYRSKNPNATFFLRDPSILQDIPKDMLERFQDKDQFNQQHLQILKDKLRDRFPEQVFPYQASFEGFDTSTGRNLVKLGKLKTFGDQVLACLKRAISRKYPAISQEKQTLSCLEQQIHHQFMESKAGFVLGREKELQVLSEFTNGKIDGSLTQTSFNDAKADKTKQFETSYKQSLDDYALTEEDHPILAVLGDSGIGKSALLAKLASNLMQRGQSVMYHCVGISHNSFRENNILLRIIAALVPELSEQEVESLSTKSVAELQSKLADCVRQQRKVPRRLTIIIDAINETATATRNLSWLLPRTPSQVWCVVSCNSQDSNAMLHLSRKKPYCLSLGAFDLTSRKIMVEQYFEIFRKTLDADQLNSLTSHSGSSNPLWLSMACEELRVYGDFRTLTHRVHALPPDLEGLFEQVLHRLLQEDQTQSMLKLLAFLCFSMAGLPESHISSLLGDFNKKTEAPPVVWATLRRQIKPLIRMITVWHTGEPRIQFFHNTIHQAVKKEVLSRGEDEDTWHGVLASYYRDICQDDGYAAIDLPHHLELAKDKKGLLHFLRTDFRSCHTPQTYRVKHAMSLRCTNMVSPFNAPEFYLCVFCDAPTRFKLSPLAGKNSEKCVICGLWIPSQVGLVNPRLCASHSKLAPPNTVMCNVCGRVIHGGKDKAFSGRLCFQCSTRRAGQNQCCQLVTT